MNKAILDASALLAVLKEERGHELVKDSLSYAIMSTVNFSEVLVVLIRIGMSENEAMRHVRPLIAELIPFDHDQAIYAANLHHKTQALGLSFGDRACIALGLLHDLPIITADKEWKKITKLEESAKIYVIR